MRRFGIIFSSVVAALAAVVMLVHDADARAGKGGSFGSRGGNTFSAPPSTSTAPNTAQPMQRTMTQPGQAQPGAAAARPATPATQPAGGGFFSGRGLLGGLAAGFLGAGLIGMLTGSGFLGGMAGFASFLGLLLQVGLVALVVFLVWRWFQNRNQPAPATGPSLREMTANRSGLGALGLGGGLGSGLGSGVGGASAQPTTDVELSQADFDTFEQRLKDVQSAYSAEDLGRLRALATPEMVSYFAEDLAENASRGVVNQVTDVKLEQGDLAESWREGEVEYASVAMRFSLVDRTIERASGRVVDGSTQPQEATEVWTFMRRRGGEWLLSAIQQAS
jgi:predicted lipid-binding transport protein (Tim44 family)